MGRIQTAISDIQMKGSGARLRIRSSSAVRALTAPGRITNLDGVVAVKGGKAKDKNMFTVQSWDDGYVSVTLTLAVAI